MKKLGLGFFTSGFIAIIAVVIMIATPANVTMAATSPAASGLQIDPEWEIPNLAHNHVLLIEGEVQANAATIVVDSEDLVIVHAINNSAKVHGLAAGANMPAVSTYRDNHVLKMPVYRANDFGNGTDDISLTVATQGRAVANGTIILVNLTDSGNDLGGPVQSKWFTATFGHLDADGLILNTR